MTLVRPNMQHAGGDTFSADAGLLVHLGHMQQLVGWLAGLLAGWLAGLGTAQAAHLAQKVESDQALSGGWGMKGLGSGRARCSACCGSGPAMCNMLSSL